MRMNFPFLRPSLKGLKLTFFYIAITANSPYFGIELKVTQKLKE